MKEFDYSLSNIKYYDIESYWTHFFIVVKDYDFNITDVFMVSDNDIKPEEYRGHKINYDKNAMVDWIRDNIVCAFNGYEYDDLMLFNLLKNRNRTARELKLISNRIINTKDKRSLDSPWDKVKSIDAKQEINTDRIHGIGLKHIAANMGLDIMETGVGFDNPILTLEELIGELDYCSNDVDVLIHAMKTPQRVNYVEQKSMLVDMVIEKYERPEYMNDKGASFRRNFVNLMKMTNGTLVSYLWADIPSTTIDWDFDLPNAVTAIWEEDWWKEEGRRNITIESCENKIVFGYGGLHGVHKVVKKVKDLFHIDVASMYPSLIINHRILGHFTEQYKEMKLARLENKMSKDAFKNAIANIQKLVLNMSYGKLLEKGSKCKNIAGGIHVCFRGQEAIYNIGLLLEPYGTIYQFNTDGIYFKPNPGVPDALWRNKIQMWESDYNLDMDIDPIDLLVQRDVNNYLAIEDGKLVSKGAIGKITFDDPWSFVNPCHKSMDNTIINKAVAEYLINDVPLHKTICNEKEDIRMYMTTFKVSSAFNGLAEGYGGKELDQKVNRIINVRNGYDYYKVKDLDASVASFAKPKTKEYKVGDWVELNGGSVKRLYEFVELKDDYIYYNDGNENKKVKMSTKYMEAKELKYGVGDEIKEGKIVEVFEVDDVEYFKVYNEAKREMKDVKCNKQHHRLAFEYEQGDIIEIEEKFKEKFRIVDIDDKKVYYEKPQRKGYQRLPNMTANCILINEDITEKTAGDYDLNYSFYMALAQKELRRWL